MGRKMKAKITLEQEINKFLEYFDDDDMLNFLHLIFEISELYDVDEKDDWVRDSIKENENADHVRMIKTAYLLSKMADFHTGKICMIKTSFSGLWKRMDEAK